MFHTENQLFATVVYNLEQLNSIFNKRVTLFHFLTTNMTTTIIL